jgi:hypothetical protein
MSDFREALYKFVLPGYIPERPVIRRDQIVLTQGSCFAAEIHHALKKLAIKSAFHDFGEEINSPAATWHIFDYALNGTPYQTPEHEKAFAQATADFRLVVPNAALLILTLGVAFVPSRNGAFTIGVTPQFLQDVTWRLTTPEENASFILRTVESARRVNPQIQVVVTVSPIPMKNSFLHDSIMAGDCLSKTTLRIAANIVVTKDPSIRYWPSFEAFRWLAAHQGNVWTEDFRHLDEEKIAVVTRAFIDAYIQPAG